MSLFPQTFSADKPIYYPSNWQTGKTAPQLYEEWKQTIQFFLLSNSVQCLIAGLWIGLIYVIFIGIKHLWRLYNLPQTKRQRIEHRRYLAPSFLLGVLFLWLIVTCGTLAILIWDEYHRVALIKGVIFDLLVIGGIKSYRIGKQKYRDYQLKRRHYERVRKDEIEQ